MQPGYSYIINACYIAAHLFCDNCCLLRYRHILCAGTDNSHTSSCTLTHIAGLLDDNTSSCLVNNHSVSLKCCFNWHYALHEPPANNSSSSAVQQSFGYCSDLGY